jgi:DNA polymerase/3'-5' exonuclease PolX
VEVLVAEARNQLEALDRKIESSDNRRQIIEEYTNITNINREITTKLIDYINIGKRNPETKQIPIEIHWNF